ETSSHALRDESARRRPGDMRFVDAKMIEQLNDILCQALKRELSRTREFGLSMAAQFQPDHAKIAREVRHPRIKAARASHCRMQQDECFALAPWIRVIVDHIAQAQAVACPELFHVSHRL